VQMKNKGAKLILGSVMRSLFLVVMGISTFFLTPFIIRHIGETMFGFWSLVGGLMGASGFLDLGLSTALKRYIPKYYATSDLKGASVVFCSSVFVFSIAGGLVAFSVVSLVGPLYLWLGNGIHAKVFTTVFLVLGIDTAFQFPMRALIGYFEGRLRYEIISLVELIKIIIRTGLIFYFLLNEYEVVAMAVITLAVNILGSLLMIIYYVKKHNDMTIGWTYVSVKAIKKLMNYSYKNMVGTVCEFIKLGSANLIIATFVGIAAVAPYAIASRIVQFLTDAISAFIGQTVPVFSDIEATGDERNLKEIYYLLVKMATILSVYLGGMALIAGKDFILRWLGPTFEIAYTLLVVLTIGITINLTISPTYNLLRGISKHFIVMMYALGEGIGTLALSLILVKTHGIVGVAVGAMVPTAFFSAVVMPYLTSRNVSYIKLPEFYFRQYGPILLKSVAILTLIYFVVSPLLAPNYLRLMVVGVISLIYFPVLYVIGFTRQEKDGHLMLRARLRRMGGNGKA
jgi:O-antigen/teichoic acid export membrane protein